LQACAQRAKAASETIDTAARQPKGGSVRVSELLGTKGCPHQTRQVVMWRADQYMTDFMGEHTPQRTCQLGVEHDPSQRERGSEGQSPCRRIE
jgi:hypothetical protein